MGLEDVATQQAPLAQLAGDLLVALVLQESRDELGTRVELVALLLSVRGQQHARLDPGERRGHQQILAGDVDVELVHQIEVLEILLPDRGDRDLRDLHLVDPDQMEQQIEGPLEGRKLDGAGSGRVGGVPLEAKIVG